MNYPSNLIASLILNDPELVWSHSKIKNYELCPYSFYLKYIDNESEEPRFFTQFGKFCHEILQKYFEGDLKLDELSTYYLSHFRSEVSAQPPSDSVFKSYFNGGYKYFNNKSNFDFGTPIGVEKRFCFNVGERKFIGFADLIAREADGTITLVDHKSKNLSERSGKKKPTKSDKELDEYFHQLQLYAYAAKKEGVKVDNLEFNCFRLGKKIKEQFDSAKIPEIEQWILESVDKIISTTQWKPSIDYFKCKFLCGFTEKCEYFQTNFGR